MRKRHLAVKFQTKPLRHGLDTTCTSPYCSALLWFWPEIRRRCSKFSYKPIILPDKIGAGLLQRSYELCYINLELRRRSPQLCKNHISEFSGPDLKAEKDGAVQV